MTDEQLIEIGRLAIARRQAYITYEAFTDPLYLLDRVWSPEEEAESDRLFDAEMIALTALNVAIGTVLA